MACSGFMSAWDHNQKRAFMMTHCTVLIIRLKKQMKRSGRASRSVEICLKSGK